MYYPEEIVEQVIAANDIVDVIGSHVHLKKSGASFMGCVRFIMRRRLRFRCTRANRFFTALAAARAGMS